MDSSPLVLAELLLIIGLVFLFGLAQLRSLQRDKESRQTKAPEAPEDDRQR